MNNEFQETYTDFEIISLFNEVMGGYTGDQNEIDHFIMILEENDVVIKTKNIKKLLRGTEK